MTRLYLPDGALLHICKSLHRLGEALYGLISVAVLETVADAVLYMSLKDDLAAAVERRLGGIELRQYILAGHILIHHAVDSLNLANDFFQTPVQIVCIHTLLHI